MELLGERGPQSHEFVLECHTEFLRVSLVLLDGYELGLLLPVLELQDLGPVQLDLVVRIAFPSGIHALGKNLYFSLLRRIRDWPSSVDFISLLLLSEGMSLSLYAISFPSGDQIGIQVQLDFSLQS